MATISNDTKQKGGFKKFLKENLYFFMIGLLVIGITTAIVVTSVNTGSDLNNEPPANVETLNPYMPLMNATIGKEYSDTELLWNATLRQWESHKAIKFIAGTNLNVYSILDGTVTDVSTTLGEGTKIVIEHSGGYRSVYSALSSNVPVTVGQKVVGGQVIGVAADTAGYEIMNAAHVNFELYKNGVRVNPGTLLDLGDK